ncbi:MAG TPA: FHA domain-containing protein, partial [Firmicutes bacterium]|nr:FHA domain-containing protein [Bacillota bacterium]
SKPAEPELEPIPVSLPQDQPVTATQAPATAAAPTGPVTALSGISGVYLGSRFELKPGSMSIGRQDADIELGNDNQVSRSHAVLAIDDGGMVTITDSGSTNGTFVNDRKVDTSPLAPGDLVRIGTTLFKAEA